MFCLYLILLYNNPVNTTSSVLSGRVVCACVCAICLFMCVCVLCYVCDRAVMSLRVLCWRVKMTSQIFPLTPPTISCSHNWVKTVTYFIQSMIYVSFSLKSHVYIMCLYRCVLSSVCVVYVCVCVQAGALITSVRWPWLDTHRLAGWWRWKTLTWMSVQKMSCCSWWCVHAHENITLISTSFKLSFIRF